MNSRVPYSSMTPDATTLDLPRTLTTFASRLQAHVQPRTDGIVSRISSFKIVQRTRSFCMTNAGLLLIAASQGFFSLMNVAVKTLNSLDPPVPALELVLVRMGITYICCMTYLLLRKIPDPFLGPPGVRYLLAIRGFTGFFGLFGVYYSLQYLSLSDATVLTFLSPLTTALAGSLFLGEQFSRREALAGLLSLVGVILIARPEFIFGSAAQENPTLSEGHGVDGVSGSHDPADRGTPGQRLGAVGVALLGVMGATGAYTSMRAIGTRAHTLHSIAFFSLWCCIVSSILIPTLRIPIVIPTRIEWLGLLLMIGVFGFSAQALLTMGLQRETAGRGAMVVYTQIIYATVFELVFFHTVPTPLSILGTIIIMGSASYIALQKQTTGTAERDSSKINASGRPSDVEREHLLEDGLLDRDSHELTIIDHERRNLRHSLSMDGAVVEFDVGRDSSEDELDESKKLDRGL